MALLKLCRKYSLLAGSKGSGRLSLGSRFGEKSSSARVVSSVTVVVLSKVSVSVVGSKSEKWVVSSCSVSVSGDESLAIGRRVEVVDVLGGKVTGMGVVVVLVVVSVIAVIVVVGDFVVDVVDVTVLDVVLLEVVVMVVVVVTVGLVVLVLLTSFDVVVVSTFTKLC